jgi:hypothetical protein
MNKLLLVGFVCVSLGAFGQSSADQGKTANGKTAAAPQAAASGKASGNRMHDAASVSEATAANPTGNKTGHDDWTQGVAAKSNGTNNGQAGTHVATGDVNSDGRADLTAAKSSGNTATKNAVMTGNSGAQGSKDAASAQTSGKRQHQPVTIRKETDAASTKLSQK